MPEGTRIPRAPYGPAEMARRVAEMGADFDEAPTLEQFVRYRGHPSQWVLRSGLRKLRMHATDAWCNQIVWELTQER